MKHRKEVTKVMPPGEIDGAFRTKLWAPRGMRVKYTLGRKQVTKSPSPEFMANLMSHRSSQ